MNYDDSQGMNITIPVMIVMIIGVRVYMWGFGDGWMALALLRYHGVLPTMIPLK